VTTPLPPDEIRQRLQLRIEERYRAPLDRKLAGVVARAARIEPTTLATYFGFYPKRRQTQRLHEDTLRKVLVAIGADPYEFLLEIGDLQLEFWPAAADVSGAPVRYEGADELRAFSDALRPLPLPLRLRVSWAAIHAGVGSIADGGGDVPAEAYELLRCVNEMLSGVRKLRLLA
jgi:hypothetical protein